MTTNPLKSSATKKKSRKAVGAPIIHYRIWPSDPAAHLFSIELTIDRPDANGQLLSMPAWIPGSYMIRDFARHIVGIDAQSAGQTVELTKTDKHTWRAEPCEGPLLVSYQVYAWDLSVRGAHLDQTHGFFNGTSVFLAVNSQVDQPVSVEILGPEDEMLADWRVATTMPSAGAKTWKFGRYQAQDYDELIDHPVEMGVFQTAGFKAGGAHHEIVITGAEAVDMKRLIKDLKPVCEKQARLFEPKSGRAPIDRYLFLTMAVGQGYGGLEHRSSTALICKRNDLPYPGMTGQPEGYKTFLGLASHEYFHTWNVKRIKPAAFAPYQLAQETYTELLWVFEGFTSYYDDLMLARAGVISKEDYLALVGQTVSRIEQGSGRKIQSIAESSYDAWTKFYRQDENAPNSIVSYYGKGALVAMALDLTIRLKSKHKKSLDDVMRALWKTYGRDFYRKHSDKGLGEKEMPALIREATGVNLTREINAWVYGTNDLPLARLLKKFGVELRFEQTGTQPNWLGCRISDQDGGCRITHVLSDGPAHQAGLSAGDTVVALDGLRVTREQTFNDLLARREAGARIKLHLFRADQLLVKDVLPVKPPTTQAKLSLKNAAAAKFLKGK